MFLNTRSTQPASTTTPSFPTLNSKRKTRILVVDDQPINIKLLQRKLEREGYEVLTASNGIECIEVAQEKKPDLILLDVMMPEMDGIEACQRLKEDEETKTIPIIFITAKSSKEGKLEGLGVGAVDYITKPIDLEETMARVKTQLRLREIYEENIELQRRLSEARRAAAVGAITQGIAHNLNNLLGVVVGYLDLLKNGFDSPDMVKRSVTLMDQAIDRMVHIIRQLSTIATNEKVAMSVLPLQGILEGSIERFNSEMDISADVKIENPLPKDFVIKGNTEVFENILVRLLTNAWEAYPLKEKPENRPITIEVTLLDDPEYPRLLFKIKDQGLGIAKEVKDTLFEPFITTKTSVGRGLGLTMARHAIRNLGGDLEVKPNEDGKGTVAIVYYPLYTHKPQLVN